jgi:hypothetical protein
MRLALRYEEFLNGLRPAIGWRTWGSERDEHFDVDDFLLRREDLGDLHGVAQSVASGSRLIVSSLMVWRFYQELAWPDGTDAVTEFCDALKTGNFTNRSPSVTLRSWARDIYQTKERIHAKRELHLLLLNRMFALHVQGDRTAGVIKWAYGFPMNTPYHPAGTEKAVETTLAALRRLDREHLKAVA